MAISYRNHLAVNCTRALLIAMGVAGASSSAGATALTVSDVFLQYFNVSPSILFGSGSERIRYGAGNVVPTVIQQTVSV
jgi:hypothetical protein